MSHEHGFSRVLCLAADAWRYGRRDDQRQFELQKALVDSLATAAERAGLDRSTWQTQPNGDGELALISDSSAEPRVVDAFVQHLDAVLGSYNRDRVPEARLRLRLAVDHGVVRPGSNGFAGQPPVRVTRLVNSDALRDALAVDANTNLAVVIAPTIFDDTIRQGHTSLSPEEFVQVSVHDKAKPFQTCAWIRVPSLDPRRLKGALDRHMVDPSADDGLLVSLQGCAWEDHGFVQGAIQRSFDTADVPSDDSWIRATGDGLLIRVSGAAAKARVLGTWVHAMHQVLRAQASGSHRMRLRFGVHCGQRQDDVALADSLASSDLAKRTLHAAHAAQLVVVVSDQVYRSVVKRGGPHLDPKTYRQDSTGSAAWVYVPGYSFPPVPVAEHTPGPTTPTAPSSGGMQVGVANGPTTVIGSGTFRTFVVGNMNGGDK